MHDAGSSDTASWAREERRRELSEAIAAQDKEDLEPLRFALEAAEGAGLGKDELDPAIRLLRKRELEQQPLTFTDVSRQDVETLHVAPSRDEVVTVLMRCMKISLDNGFQSEVLAEFHYHNFNFCLRRRLSVEKTSTFLSIMNVLHTRAVVDEKLSESQAGALFESLIDKHSWQLPPYKVGVFSQEEAMALREYVNKSFLRHYSMYAYMYIKQVELSAHGFYGSIVARMPEATELHRCFEVDPQNVPELWDMFHDPETEASPAVVATETAPTSAGTAVPGRLPAETVDGHEAAVLSAVSKAEQELLGSLNFQLQTPK